ncbi:DUF7513 family protein [Haloarchaeobius iranensis]|uniref:DUF7513 domain-containing protein n=1 Tax=Haloarchaeobius iranensis TaxID=996166 RepID=A0A1G9WFD3_9EURY|nr:hypothetical protein [Haloarchaeobius iranensis]SDM83264.1 hypothetical protein SAMN05192554_10844 [Haloarchaeobius iranensis]
MSYLSSVLAGVGFRTRTPAFDPGEEVTAFVSGVQDGAAVIRIGDSRLSLPGVEDPDVLVDERVRVRVEEFDETSHSGSGVLVEVVDGRGL